MVIGQYKRMIAASSVIACSQSTLSRKIHMSNKKQVDIYLVLDIESDGPAPGLNNMLTMGVAAFSPAGENIDKFYERIIPLPDLSPNPETMIWWREQSSKAYYEAFDQDKPGVVAGSASKDRVTAFDAMLNFAAWLNYLELNTKSTRFIAVAWPAAFDFPYVNYYCHRFLRRNPLGYDALDIRSYVMGLLRKQGYFDVTEAYINALFERSSTKLNHIAIDDAVAQGELFFYIRNHPLASRDMLKLNE